MDLPNGRSEVIEYWRNHFADLASAGLAPVQNNPLRGDTFVDISIEGQRFIAAVTKSGPYVGCKGRLTGDCALGVASINFCKPFYGAGDRGQEAWRVCKYHTQGHIDLPPLTESGLRSLAYHFGLPLVPRDPVTISIIPTEWAFYVSPAFDALVEWAKSHPRKIKKAEPNDYLWNWPRAALSGAAEDADNYEK